MSRCRPLVLLTGLAAALLAAGACRESTGTNTAAAPPSPDTWAVVDGRQIAREDVEKAFRRQRDPSEELSEEEALAAKLDILDGLVVQDILLARASSLGVSVPDSELDAAYANARNNLSEDAYRKELGRRNLTSEDMREGLRREMLAQKVIEQELGPKLAVTDKEVTDFFTANRARFNVPEESYHLAQIVVTPVREPQVGNTTGNDATTPEAAAAKVKMLMERLKAGASFRDLAAAYSEDPETAARGGDLGYISVSQVKGLPPALRNAVIGKEPGSVNVVSAGGAHTLVLVVAHEPAGQRDLSTPGVKERITETLRGRREGLLRMAYVTTLRGEARVENLLAKRLLEGTPAAPGLLPAAPGR